MNERTTRRRTRKLVPWVVAGIAAVAISSCLALVVWAWLQEAEIKSLRAGLEIQQQERAVLEARFVASQSTATALEGRLAVLERGPQAAGETAASESATTATWVQRPAGTASLALS